MPSVASYILFHTDVCHLCEQAQALIDTLGIDYIKQDICDVEELAERYGTRIPVLLRQADQSELNWPFDIQQLQKFTGA
ncbi:glutaredoxin family protein [Shewanella psychrotolerans]|uniref:glutaredoxin family protein n=1 Tax=Shewanella psychrotolerans TaxID=2864206 RepID=UPI001C65B8F1|nr:glutaredoxin family protein [Shewanella psychrotolerans]QYK03025.1 glutaredoxin family protein [Shewanella psychrotolerans]